ncbi:MAG: hypothetical protein ACMUIE_02945 [Thermoplasmatota archaeon]
MRTFQLYDPKVYSLTILNHTTKKGDPLLNAFKTELHRFKGVKCDFSSKEGWTIIELMKEINPEAKGSTEVSVDHLKIKHDELMAARKALVDIISSSLSKDITPYNFTLFTSGSHNSVWLKTYSDMSFLYSEHDDDRLEILQTNITQLNRVLNRAGEVNVNSMMHGKIDSSLYILGPPQGTKKPTFPTDFVLEIDLTDVRATSSYGESPIQVTPSTPYADQGTQDKRIYQQKQSYLINLLSIKSKLIDLFILHSSFIDYTKTEFKDIEEKGRSLKDQIFKLQNSINEHMKLYIPKEKDKKSKKKDFLDRETYEAEKQFLTAASVRFSLVSEVEHQIMRNNTKLQDLSFKVNESTSSLSLEKKDVAMEGTPLSLGDLTLREIETKKRELMILMDELSHSRDILTSTIEVLRTFIDTRQREVSEDMSRLMNLLFLVFACIGLADALGNFVILVLDRGFLSGDPTLTDVVRAGSLGMVLTLVPLLIAAIFLYLYFKRKR